MAKAVWITVPEYASRVKKTPQYIRKVIKNGKITKRSLKKRGKRFLVDPVKADQDLLENTSYINKKPVVKHDGKTTKAQPKKKPTQEEQQKTIKSAGLEIVSFAEAQTLKENYLAALRKLEYKTKSRDLLPADEVRKVLADIVLSARSKILAIKGKLAPLLKEFIDDPENFGIAMDNVETAIRDILTEMAESGIKK